jgi:hypothetical protein
MVHQWRTDFERAARDAADAHAHLVRLGWRP